MADGLNVGNMVRFPSKTDTMCTLTYKAWQHNFNDSLIVFPMESFLCPVKFITQFCCLKLPLIIKVNY